MELEYIITKNDVNKTVKDILLSNFKISHRLLLTLKRQEKIFLNNCICPIYKSVNENDKITISFDYIEDNSNILPKEMNLDIIYEDDWLLVINKPSGIPVHPSMSHFSDSLSNGVRFYFDKIRLKKKIRPVIRIDRDTSRISCFCKK